jgi:hypothetical protein
LQDALYRLLLVFVVAVAAIVVVTRVSKRLRGRPGPAQVVESATATSLDVVAEASEESFPASDAPGWLPVHI